MSNKIWAYGICNTFALLLRHSDDDETVEYKWSNEDDDNWKEEAVTYALNCDTLQFEAAIDVGGSLYFLHDFC